MALKARGYHTIIGFSCMIYLVAADWLAPTHYDNWSKTFRFPLLTNCGFWEYNTFVHEKSKNDWFQYIKPPHVGVNIGYNCNLRRLSCTFQESRFFSFDIGGFYMDAAFLRKTFALIAKGVAEKEQLLQKEPTCYPYSKTLQHGINMFLAASDHAGHAGDTALNYVDESSFLAHFITKPITDWFCDWEPDAIEKLSLKEEPFYGYEAFAYRRSENIYTPSSECYEFLETQDGDIMDGTDERILYEKMILLDQEAYCQVRRYIIEHPIITLEDRRMMSLELADNQAARDAFQFAYEEITEVSYRCPCCGWTMTQGKYGYSCHSSHCADIIPVLTDEMKLDVSGGGLYRLKKGVMRYFAAPGKLELDIVTFCEKRKISWVLWPQMDRYDVEIQFSDGDIWEIDAKAYRNPIALRTKIQNDNGFPDGSYARGYFVVPGEYTVNQRNYIAIINRSLVNQKNVKCITLMTLKTEISRKEASCHEEK